jgi:hypothetical protein
MHSLEQRVKQTWRPRSHQEPLVSVVMAVRNASAFLPAALESIAGQSVDSLEIIVIDDASTDDTSAILSAQDDSRLRVIRNEECVGQTASLNKGLAVARGEYIARMDGDDISFPERFADQIDHLRGGNAVLTGSGAVLIDAEGQTIGSRSGEADPLLWRWRMMFRNVSFHSSLMWCRRDVEKLIGPYDETLEYAQDYDLLARARDVANVSMLRRPLIYFRQHDAAKGHTGRRDQDAAAAAIGARMLSPLLPGASPELLQDVRSVGGKTPERVAPERLATAASALLAVLQRFVEERADEVRESGGDTLASIRDHVSQALLLAGRSHVRHAPKAVMAMLVCAAHVDRRLAVEAAACLGLAAGRCGWREAKPHLLGSAQGGQRR